MDGWNTRAVSRDDDGADEVPREKLAQVVATASPHAK
jgi:hypothetical protein